MRLEDRVAIVTGAAQGIGKAIADRLADEGATVVVADLNGPAAEQAAPAGGAGIECDVSSTDDVKQLVSETLSRFGKLDVLVNNASIHPFTAWDDLGFDEWRRIMATRAETFKFALPLQSLPRRGVATDIAPSVAFLASEEAGWVTGQMLVVDGGMTHN
jgi:NAD(P)-dependent dehydrogenase (short-subunit alcohol dehydrogenase family)